MSVSSEALFSWMGDVVTKRRSRMNVQMIKKVMIAKSLHLRFYHDQKEPRDDTNTRHSDGSSAQEVDLESLVPLDYPEDSDENDYGNESRGSTSPLLSANPFDI